MYAQLFFHAPTMLIANGDQARGWVATKLPGVPKVVFNRGEDGRTLQGHSPFAIRPHNQGVVVEGVGRDAFELLMRLALQVQPLFLQQYPDGEFSFGSGLAGLDVGAYPREYAVHDFILENNSGRRGLYRERKERIKKGAPSRAFEAVPELAEVAEELLRTALDRRCELLGLSVPAGASIALVEAGDVRPCRAGGGTKLLYAVEVRFTSNLIFAGPWYLGRLASKGCGRLISAPRRGRSVPGVQAIKEGGE